ncbi:MAG: iron chaperone [Microbacterium sp.]|uniref:iron chaperone n=1 Tax=Microbacterium sp. TaxID=51671 RepID=UPI003A861F92
MKERAAELKAQKSGPKGTKAQRDLQACLDAIAALPDDERVMAERIHAIVAEVAPQLQPKTWYGFPSYARDGKIVVFFSPASKFKTRYSSLGFEEAARLDDGDMWPVGFALTKVGDAEAARITELVKRAAG